MPLTPGVLNGGLILTGPTEDGTDGQVLVTDGAGQLGWESVAGVGTPDHGDLTGLGDDDHTQYHNDARGDARYSQLGHTHSGVYSPVGHSHAISDTTGLQTALDSKAAAAHTHAIEDTTGLQAALDSKSTERYVPLHIFIGESNASGLAANTDATAGELASHSRLQILNNTSLAFEGLDVGTNNAGNDGATHGWEIGLANSIEAEEWIAETHYLVKCGVSGSVVSHWGEGSANMLLAATRIQAALNLIAAAGKTPLIYVWFTLGQNDAAAATNIQTFKTALIDLLIRIRKIVGMAPIGLTSFAGLTWMDLTPMTAAIREVAALVPFCRSVSSEGLSVIAASPAHWDYAGMKGLADNFIAVFQSLAGENDSFAQSQATAINLTLETPTINDGEWRHADWTGLSSTVDHDGGTLHRPSGSGGGARATLTLDASEAFSVEARYSNWTLGDGVIISLDENDDENYNWEAGLVFVAGMEVYAGDIYANVGGFDATDTGDNAPDSPHRLRMTKSGNDIVYSLSTDAGETWTNIYTASGVLTGVTTLYVKARFATAGERAVTVYVQSGSQTEYQPLDGDLTSLADITSTDVLVYRAAADTWTAVTIGTGLDFTDGTLSATGGEGGGVTDHGALTGLSDDDHTQYHTDARGDARYSQLGHDHSGTYQPLDGDLTALAALGYTSGSYLIKKTAANTYSLIALTAAGEALLDDADTTAQRSTLGLGGAAVLNVGTGAGTVCAGDDSRLTDERTPVDDSATNAKLADMAVNTIKGRVSSGTGNPEDLTVAQVAGMLGGTTGSTLAVGNHTHTAANVTDFNSAALAAAPAETTTTIGTLIDGATAKTTPVDADLVGLVDSAASNILKKLSWSNIKATLKTYFDALYWRVGNTAGTIEWKAYSPVADDNTTTGDRTLVLQLPFACTINSVYALTTSGTISLNFKINSTSITGLSAVSVSSTPATTNATAANTAVLNDTLKVTLSSPSTPVGLMVVVNYTK